jgi:polysaccharide biosynthesis protein PslH
VLLANFAYQPNVDAALHMCHDILPAVRSQVPDVRLWLVGNEPPPEVRELGCAHVEVTGRVADVAPYLDAADVVVCPLRIGGGIKVKAIEALRRGKAIVSTSIGMQGLPESARDAVITADDPDEFADAVAALLSDSRLNVRHQRRAARAATQLATWDEAAEALAGLYDELIADAVTRDPGVVRRSLAGGPR